MLNCPFCGYDYTEEGPREGRCPACGGVLSWNGAIIEQEEAAVVGGDESLDVRDRPAVADRETLPAAGGQMAGEPPGFSPVITAPPASSSPASARPPSDHPASGAPAAEPSPGSQTDQRRNARTLTADAGLAAATNPRELTGTDRSHVTAVWAKSLEGIVSPRTTIEAAALGELRTSALVIRPRTVRRPHDETTSPADYELREVIGEGGVGVVYAARQSCIDRTVAVKMLKQETVSSDDREKFLFEAMITGDLDHPNIVPIYDLGSNKFGDLFYSMKRVRGTPWCDVMGEKTLAQNLEILMKSCDAIAFAHARGVVHRDIKPENVMLGDFGEVLMMDWGISLSTSLTVEGGAVATASTMGGTPAYMAPEMATGPIERIGAASDVYLLGAVLYEIVTGLTPHTGRSVMECLMAAARNQIQPPNTSGELLDVALRAMATNIEDRYASVQDLQDAIRQYQAHSESIALSTRAEEDLERAVRTNDPEDFARTVFGFEEAHLLWPGNRTAREGLSKAKLAYAQSAFEKDDFRLGLSVLDADNPDHSALRRKLEVGVRERESRRQRLKNLKRLAGLLVFVMAVGASIAFLVILGFWQSAESAKQIAVNERAEAKRHAKRAQEGEEKAREQKSIAEQRKKEADRAADRAVKAKRQAEDAHRKTKGAMQREEAQSYLSEIRLTYGQIGNNDYDRARETLNNQSNSTKRFLRHWEWGHLQHLCELDTVTRQAADENAGPLEAVAFSPDDRWRAAGSSNGSVFLWRGRGDSNGAPSQPLAVIQHEAPVDAVAFSHDGQLLATGGGTDRTGEVKIWELADQGRNPTLIHVLSGRNGHRGQVTSVEFSADDRQLLTASFDHTARLWHARQPLTGLVEDPARLWRDRQGDASPAVFRGHFDTVWDAHFSHDDAERWVVTASEDGTVRIWDRERCMQVQRFSQHKGAVYAVAVSPDNRHVVAAGDDGEIFLWDTKLKEQLRLAERSGQTPGKLFRKTFVEDVKRRLDDQKPEVPTFQRLLGHRGSVFSVDFSRTGALVLSGSMDHTLKIWDSGLAIPGRQAAPGPDFEQRMRLRARAPESGGTDASLLTLRGHGSWVRSAHFSADGKSVLSGSHDMTAKLWKFGEYRELRTFQGPDRAVLSAAMSPDEKYVAAAFDNGKAQVWSAEGEPHGEIPPLDEGHEYLTSRAVFSPDAQQLYTTAADGTVRVWGVRDGTERRCMKGTGHRGLLALSRDGKWLITGGVVKDDIHTDASNPGDAKTDDSEANRAEANDTSAEGRAASDAQADNGREVPQLWNTETNEDKFIDHGFLDHGIDLLTRLERAYPTANREELIERIPEITVACLSTDGRLAFAGDEHGVCWLWDTASDAPPKHWDGHSLSVTAAAFTADDGALFTASADRTVARWDPQTGEQIGKRLAHGGAVTLLDVAAGGGSEPSVLTAATRRQGAGLSGDPDSESRAMVYLWRPGVEDPQTAVIPANRINSAIFTPDGRGALIAAAAGRRHDVWFWDFDRDAAERVWNDSVRRGSISTAVFVPHTETMQVLTVGGNGARLWDRASGQMLITFRPHDAITSVRFSPDSEWVVTASRDGSAKIWTYREKVMALCKLEGGADGDANVRGHRGPVNSAEFHPHEGKMQVVTCSDDGTAKLWQPDGEGKAWSVRRTFAVANGHRHPVRAARFSPDGNQILTVSDDGHARIWNALDEEQPPVVISCHEGPVLCGTYSADGKWIATSGRDRTVAVFDVATKAELARLPEFSAAPSSVAFSPDRLRMVTGEATTLRLWNLEPLLEQAPRSGQTESSVANGSQKVREILALDKHEREITSVSFSPSGCDVLSAGLDGQTILWPGKAIEPAVTLSLDEIDYHEPNKPMFVGNRALVRTPGWKGTDRLRLEVRITSQDPNPPTDREWLELGDNGSQAVRIRDDHQVQFNTGDAWVAFADFSGSVQGSQTMQFNLNRNASGPALEALVRCVTYRREVAPESEQTRKIEFLFTNPDEESPPVRQPPTGRTIRIAAAEPPLEAETAIDALQLTTEKRARRAEPGSTGSR